MKKVITLISIALSVSFMFISSKKKCDFFIYSELSLNSYSKKNDTFSITLYQTIEETNFNYGYKYNYYLINDDINIELNFVKIEENKKDKYYELNYYFKMIDEDVLKDVNLKMTYSDITYTFKLGDIYFIDSDISDVIYQMDYDLVKNISNIYFSYESSQNILPVVRINSIDSVFYMLSPYEEEYKEPFKMDSEVYKFKICTSNNYYIKSLFVSICDLSFYVVNHNYNERFFDTYD